MMSNVQSRTRNPHDPLGIYRIDAEKECGRRDKQIDLYHIIQSWRYHMSYEVDIYEAVIYDAAITLDNK